MRDYAEICELCDRMRLLINCAALHHCTISEALVYTIKQAPSFVRPSLTITSHSIRVGLVSANSSNSAKINGAWFDTVMSLDK